MESPKLQLLVLRSTNIEQLKDFYEKLGLVFQEEKHGKGPVHYSATIEGGVVIEIYPAERADNTRVGFFISNLDTMVQTLEKAGVNIHEQPRQTPYGYYAVIKDPDGRSIELHGKPRE